MTCYCLLTYLFVTHNNYWYNNELYASPRWTEAVYSYNSYVFNILTFKVCRWHYSSATYKWRTSVTQWSMDVPPRVLLYYADNLLDSERSKRNEMCLVFLLFFLLCLYPKILPEGADPIFTVTVPIHFFFLLLSFFALHTFKYK